MISSSTMAKRSYKQNCALAQASDLIGERWSLLLIRDLLAGPRRFNDARRLQILEPSCEQVRTYPFERSL